MNTKQCFLGGLFLLVGLALFSCKSDDDEPSIPVLGTFSHKGINYDLSQGLLTYYGTNSDGQSADFDIILTSESLNLNPNNGTLGGRGFAVYFDLNSSSLSSLSSGKYEFDPSTPRQAFQMITGSLTLDFDYNEGNPTGQEIFANSGEVLVNRTGSDYNISFDVSLVDGSQLTGSFVGPLTRLDLL